MQEQKTGSQPIALTLTVVAACLRLLPHPPNFTPVGATALFGGARLRGWMAYVVPLLALLVTDPLRSFFEGGFPAYSWGTLVIYGSFLVSVLLGRLFLKDSAGPARIAAVAFAGSVQFFLLTNFFVWFKGTMYPHNAGGLAACYTAGLPFFGYTVAGDLLYSAALFTVYAWWKRRAQVTADAA